MDPLLLVIVAIAAVLGIRWYRGGRENAAVLLSATRALERAFSPVDTQYTNIGGTVGYNFVYSLSAPFRRLEGTLTTLPRHAVLYLPISVWILKREDLLLFTVYYDALPPGIGHIAEAERFRRGSIPLDDRENLDVTWITRERRTFSILWYNAFVRKRLEGFLDQLSDSTLECLHYVGYFGGESSLAFTLNPIHPSLEKALAELVEVLRGFGNEV
ncbi:MAG: hypothetical protein ACLFPV_14190 [Spirochaetaceae bacterium]